MAMKRSPLRPSLMKTVVVTRLASEPPARSSVRLISARMVRACSSNLPEMSLPSRSVVVVWPASQTVLPPSVMTAGEKPRLLTAFRLDTGPAHHVCPLRLIAADEASELIRGVAGGVGAEGG